MKDATSRLIAAIIAAFWGLVLIGFALWLSKHDPSGMGAAFACLVYSIGYFCFAWFSYHDHGDDGAGEDRLRRTRF